LADGDPDLAQISALVVTFVVLDSRSLTLLTPAQITSLAAKFSAPSSTNLLAGKLAAESWAATAADATQFSGLPPAAVRSLRVYQRFIPLPFPSN
jgi:hypothetical protein